MEPSEQESVQSFAFQLEAAGFGNPDALGNVLERFRRFLTLRAAQEIGDDLKAKLGASDVVQQTFLEAQVAFDQFRGETPDQLYDWLQQILLNNVRQAADRFCGTQKRDVRKEVVRWPGFGETDYPQELPLDTPSPSQKVAANEESQKLQGAVRRLPEDYQRVLRLRHQEDKSFAEIGELIERSPDAVRKLWGRAIMLLQKELEE